MKENYRITKNSISIMGGICFILFAFVTLFSNNTPFEFLSNIITHSLGFIGFWLVLPYLVILGFYLALKKKIFKLRIGVSLWGFFIIILCLLILSSHWASWGTVYNGIEITGFGHTSVGTAKYLTFSNSMAVFDEIDKNIVTKVGPTTKMGGGKIGFILAGALNSSITPVGLNIVCWILFIAGIIMVFNQQISGIKSFISRRVLSKGDSFKEVDLSMADIEPSKPIPVQIEEPKPTPNVTDKRPIFESFHTSGPINNDFDLKKAKFVLQNDDDKPKEVLFEAIKKPTFEPEEELVSRQIKEEIVNENNDFEPYEEDEKTYSEPFFTPLKEAEEAKKEIFIEEPEPQVEPAIDFLNQPQPKAQLVKNYIYPSIDLLNPPKANVDNSANEESCRQRAEIINNALKNLNIGAEVVSWTVGPSVTRFDVLTHADSTVNAIQKYVNDLSVRLNGESVRYEPIVAGKSTSGLEIPNEVRTNVTLREVLEELPKGVEHNMEVPFGKSISGELKFANLADFPHMLIAGSTGSGKSIFVHSLIITLITRNKPEELKLIMVDPKKVEMNYYDDIPHLLCPVICDLRKTLVCFNKLVNEMERRYNLFKDNKVRDIKGFNELAKEKDLQPLPYICVFIDEYADLVETYKEIREPVVKLCQKARAAGIHMVFATQRPSVNVIDGNIKANVSTRVALSCSSYVDSMTVIGTGGAEKLLGHGDMIVDCPLISRSVKPRVQGCYVSEVEINRICDFLREHYQPQFDPMYLNLDPVVEEKHFDEQEATPIDKTKTDEEAYQKIKEDARHREYFSISYITRTYGMGYSRAGKMFTRLQNEGVVARQGDARGCKVLIYTPGSEQVTTGEQSSFIPDNEF